MTEGENMVERCARALALDRAEPWEDMNDDERRSWTESARAVIEALMEPTPEMILACWQNHHPWGRNAPVPEDRPDMFADMEHRVRADWQAMLRTTLSKPNDEGERK